MARLTKLMELPQQSPHRPRQNRSLPLPVLQDARRLRKAHRPLTQQTLQDRLAI